MSETPSRRLEWPSGEVRREIGPAPASRTGGVSRETGADGGASPEIGADGGASPETGAGDGASREVGAHRLAVPGARPRRRTTLVIAAGVAAGVAVAGYLAVRPEPPGDDASAPAVALSPVDLPGPPTGAVPPVAPSASASAVVPSKSAKTRSSRPAAGRTTTAPATRNVVQPPKTTAPTAGSSPRGTVAAAQRSSFSGKVVNAGGLCLDLHNYDTFTGGAVQVFTCTGGGNQGWELSSDGLLKTLGWCAYATGSGSVEIDTCHDDAAGRWRVGPGGAVVNEGRSGCLTGSATIETRVQVTACSGAAGQRWDLP